MTDETDHPLFGGPEQAAALSRQRMIQISALFDDMKALMEEWLADPGQADKTTATKMRAKLGDMQAAHVMLLREEEAFYEKFSQRAAEDAIDYDAIRDDIGRRLDWIRAAKDAG